jgi:regulator of RNase E activity RraA
VTAVSDVVSVIGDLSAATLHEAGGKTGALPAAIRPIRLGLRVVGPALPVCGPSGDNVIAAAKNVAEAEERIREAIEAGSTLREAREKNFYHSLQTARD